MTSTFAATREFDDVEKMFGDLSDVVSPRGGAGGIGFLSCSSRANYDALTPLLRARAPFPIVGGTTLASPFASRGDEFGAALTVVRNPEIRNAVGVSAPIDSMDDASLVRNLYRECLAGLGADPGVILVFMPVIRGLMADRFMPGLFELAGDVPVFGGMVSDDFDSHRFAVFADGRPYRDRIVLVMLGGGIRPLFGVDCDVTQMSPYAFTVGEARGNDVLRVDDMTFCEFLRELGFREEVNRLTDFLPSVIVRGGMSERDGRPEITHLVRTDPESGAGTFATAIAAGSTITLGRLSRRCIEDSANRCLAEMACRMGAMQQEGYAFSMVFCLPCVARHFAAAGGDNIDGEAMRRLLPAGVPWFGYYGFNEICPTTDRNGRLFNRPHSDSIAVCAF